MKKSIFRSSFGRLSVVALLLGSTLTTYAQVDGLSATNNAAIASVSKVSKVREQYSPDGQHFLYVNANGELVRQDSKLNDSNKAQTLSTDGQVVAAFAINSDSSWVAYMDAKGSVYRIAMTGDAATRVALHTSEITENITIDDPHNAYYFQIEISADEQYVIYTHKKKDSYTYYDYNPETLDQDPVTVIYNLTTLHTIASNGATQSVEIAGGFASCYSFQPKTGVTYFRMSPDGQNVLYNYANRYYDSQSVGCSYSGDLGLYSASVDGLESELVAYHAVATDFVNPNNKFPDYYVGDGGRYMFIESYDLYNNGENILWNISGGNSLHAKSSLISSRNDFNATVEKLFDGLIHVGNWMNEQGEDLGAAGAYFHDVSGVGELTQDKSKIIYTVTALRPAGLPISSNDTGLEKYRNVNRLNKVYSTSDSTQSEFLFPLFDAALNCREHADLVYIDKLYKIQPICDTLFGDFTVSADGNTLVFIAKPNGQNDSPRIFVYDRATGAPVVELGQLTSQPIQTNTDIGDFHSEAVETETLDFNMSISEQAGYALYVENGQVYAVALDGSGTQALLNATDYVLAQDGKTVVLQTGENSVALYDLQSNSVITQVNAQTALSIDEVVMRDNGDIHLLHNATLYQLNLPDAAPITLNNRSWNSVSVAQVPEAGIAMSEALSGSGFDMSSYGRQWIMYGVNAVNASYMSLSSDAMLSPDKGYWLFHASGQEKSYSAQGAGATMLTDNANCPSSAGCYTVDVPSSYAVQLIGMPSTQPVKWADILVEVDGVTCTIAQAQNAKVLGDRFWSYNGAGYDVYSTQLPPTGDAQLEPYRGYWVHVQAAGLGKNITLLLPAGAVDNTQSPSCAL